METNNQMENQSQIVISTSQEGKKQALPLNLILLLAGGTLAGIVLIFALFMGANYFVNL